MKKMFVFITAVIITVAFSGYCMRAGARTIDTSGETAVQVNH